MTKQMMTKLMTAAAAVAALGGGLVATTLATTSAGRPDGTGLSITHLVTDKPLYKPGETIRFRSLTLDRSNLRPPENDLHLIFRLRDPGEGIQDPVAVPGAQREGGLPSHEGIGILGQADQLLGHRLLRSLPRLGG